jgi:trehalose utilization protein
MFFDPGNSVLHLHPTGYLENIIMLKVAVITGGHHFEVMAFHQLFRDLPGIDAYVQHMADFVATSPDEREQYDVLVFYTHLKGELTDIGQAPNSKVTVRSVLESLGTTPQGLVILHHSLLAFPDWKIWDDIIGMDDRQLMEYAHDQEIDLHIADPAHPICAGLTDWHIVDETYLMPDAPADTNHILITTGHNRNMTTLAWTRQFKSSRVFCLQLGHDHQTWQDAGFKTLLAQGIAWSANRNVKAP